MKLEFHPLANLFPLIEGEEFDDLVGDIRAHGLQDVIDVYQGKILDGRNRYRAAQAAGVEIERRNIRNFAPEFYGDPLAYVISKNLRRRHLDDRQRASVAGKIANLSRGRPSGSTDNPPIGGISADEAAAALKVSPRQVERARVVHEYGAPELRDAFDRGDVPVSVAEKIARLPMVDQPRAVRELPRGHRAIMGSRIEPDESDDFFPTPPWATRALVEHVLPAAGVKRLDKIWEPACGEGHMAEALAEYAPVSASDLNEYGYGDAGVDFLALKSDKPLADWIITNPPFKDKTEPFVMQARKLARVGVAMFVRMQWLETIGRYERIFRDTPPTIIAFFSERVPLCKGEWKPDGDTATAYIWLVWIKGRAPQAPFWIPPDCRTSCARPDDEMRFTTHPVTRKEHVYCDEPFDASSGEIIATAGNTEEVEGRAAETQQCASGAAEFTTIEKCCDRDPIIASGVVTTPILFNDTATGIIRWKKSVGDHVVATDVIAEIEGESEIIEFEAGADGIIHSLLFDEGSDAMQPGDVIAELRSPEIIEPRPEAQTESESPGEIDTAIPEQFRRTA